jgi:flagellar hook-associated protein 1 FlgK
MAAKSVMASAGNIYSGSYNFSEYAAASISVVSTNASHSKDQQTYQKSLGDSLNTQYTSFSGVNLDEEVANMINFQQAYSASAKVIATLQEMLDTLVNTIR